MVELLHHLQFAVLVPFILKDLLNRHLSLVHDAEGARRDHAVSLVREARARTLPWGGVAKLHLVLEGITQPLSIGAERSTLAVRHRTSRRWFARLPRGRTAREARRRENSASRRPAGEGPAG